MNPKCHRLDWRVDASEERVVADLSFRDFEQSQRFVKLLIDFIKQEREPVSILDDLAWYCPQQPPGA